MRLRYADSKSVLEYAELAVAGDDAVTLYAYKRSQKCPWRYQFEYHREVTEKLARDFSKNLIWC